MEKCIDCIHYKACEDWAKSFYSYEETTFPYEAENNLCEHYESVVYGKWIETGNGTLFSNEVHCSICGRVQLGETSYCPNCGARMDGGK